MLRNTSSNAQVAFHASNFLHNFRLLVLPVAKVEDLEHMWSILESTSLDCTNDSICNGGSVSEIVIPCGERVAIFIEPTASAVHAHAITVANEEGERGGHLNSADKSEGAAAEIGFEWAKYEDYCCCEEFFTLYNTEMPSEKYRVPLRLMQRRRAAAAAAPATAVIRGTAEHRPGSAPGVSPAHTSVEFRFKAIEQMALVFLRDLRSWAAELLAIGTTVKLSVDNAESVSPLVMLAQHRGIIVTEDFIVPNRLQHRSSSFHYTQIELLMNPLAISLADIFFKFFVLTDMLTLHTIRQVNRGYRSQTAFSSCLPPAKLAQLLYKETFEQFQKTVVVYETAGSSSKALSPFPAIFLPFYHQLESFLSYSPDLDAGAQVIVHL